MPIEDAAYASPSRARIDLWLFSSGISSLLFALVQALPALQLSLLFQLGAVVDRFIYYLALLATYSVAVLVLYFPFVLYFKDAKGWHFWITLATGTLIGPAGHITLGLIFQWAGGNIQRIWVGDGLEPGILVSLPWEFGFSFTTSILYVMALRSRTRDHRVSN